MMDKNYVWRISYNPENTIDRETAGKWVIHKKHLKRIFKKIDELVDLGLIHKAKYTHKEFLEYDRLPFEKPVLCVYADDNTKEQTYIELINLGLQPEFWKYDKETERDWKKGGKLYEKSVNQTLLKSCLEIEKFRKTL